ncbi:MAG TPA: zf-HC2 domain-containing protein [Ruminiclostridium sp.]
MNVKCNVIRDLLPLYTDELLSDDSKELIEKHIKDCDECSNTLKLMKEEIEIIDKAKLEKNIKSQKPFRKLKKNIIILSVFLIILSLLLGIFISSPQGTFNLEAIAARRTIDKMLNLVEEKRYDEAFEYVYYFDKATDITPSLSYEEAKKLWIERFKEFDLKSTDKITWHRNITTRMEDGYLKGSVEIQIKNPYNDDFMLTDIWFSKAEADGKWRIGNFYNSQLRYTFEIVLSGNLTEQDRKQNYIGK